MEPIGRIFGEPTNETVNIVSLNYYPGKFVQTNDADTDLCSIYKIIELKAKNKHFSAPENIKYINTSENIVKDVIYIFEARHIATIKDNMFCEQPLPAYPGQLVFPAEDKNIATAYDINPDGMLIGSLSHAKEVCVYLDPDKIFNPHLLVIGRTGSGKSYFTKGLIRKMQRKDWTTLIFSPSEEYNDVVENINVLSSRNIILPYNENTMEYLWGLTANESLQIKKFPPVEHAVYSPKKYMQWILDSYLRTNRKLSKANMQHQMSFLNNKEQISTQLEFELPNVLSSLLNKINKRRINFSSHTELISTLSGTVVIDMSFSSQVDQECILYSFMLELLKSQKRKQMCLQSKYLVVIEEAHNYIPSVKSNLCKEAIVRMAREGRKYGISLCFITQRPRNFDQTAFSQASNKCIFALPHPDDVRHVLDDVSYYSSDLTSLIQRQRVGECTFNGDAYRGALSVHVAF